MGFREGVGDIEGNCVQERFFREGGDGWWQWGDVVGSDPSCARIGYRQLRLQVRSSPSCA